jgi:hypothetical protein
VAKLIDPHRVVAMEVLPDGKLLTFNDEVLPSVGESRERYSSFAARLHNSADLNAYEEALKRRWKEIAFDEVCGHWIGTWRPHVISEYCYLGVALPDKRLNLGLHVVAYLGLVGTIPEVPITGGKVRRQPIDHRCYVKICCNPLHLALETSATNNSSSRHAHRQARLGLMGQEVLFDPHGHLR